MSDDIKKQFSDLYDEHVDKIYRFIYLKVNYVDIAQDLTSEVFMKAWRAFKNVSDSRESTILNPKAFFYRIARNLVIDHYRQKNRNHIISANDSPIIDPSQGESIVLANSDLSNIKSAISNLNPDYQTVLTLRYIEDMPTAEIAKIMDKTDGAVRIMVHRALRALKREIGEA